MPMPSAAPKPCRHVGCGTLVRDGSGYCEQHQSDRKNGKFADDRRGSRQSRGYGAEWDKRRKRILHRDKGLCQVHLKDGRYRPATEVDHIVNKADAKARGWSDEQIEADINLQSICTECHQVKTAEEAKRGRG